MILFDAEKNSQQWSQSTTLGKTTIYCAALCSLYYRPWVIVNVTFGMHCITTVFYRDIHGWKQPANGSIYIYSYSIVLNRLRKFENFSNNTILVVSTYETSSFDEI